MASASETRGQVARMMARVDGVEIKAVIPQNQVEAALQLYPAGRSNTGRIASARRMWWIPERRPLAPFEPTRS